MLDRYMQHMGKIKTFYRISRATEVIWCPSGLLKGFHLNTEYFISFTPSLDIASYSPKYIHFFIKKTPKNNRIFFSDYKIRLLLQGILTA